MQWSSEKLYDGRLLADVSVAQHLLRDLPGVKDAEVTTVALLLIDTTGCDLYEIETSEEESKGNEGEAEVVALHVEALVSSGVKQSNIGIITPYNLQVYLMRSIRIRRVVSYTILPWTDSPFLIHPFFTHPFLSCLIPSHLILSCIIPSYSIVPDLSCPLLSFLKLQP